MDINNQDNFSQLINLSLLTTFYTQLKNQFVLIDNYNDFYNSVNQKIQENTKNIDDIKINLNNNYYTKDDIDSEFDLLNQGIMTNYYSKTDIDSKIIVINNNINNLSQNLNNNYYNKTYIDSNFLSLSGGTLQGNLIAPTFIGNLNGNANTSSLANKVSNKLIFTGGFVGEYDGSSELNVIIPTSGATEGILTIQLNGGTTEDVDKITFNGVTNKSINITPESIGAITQSILNNYLPLTGGTLTGSLTAPIFNGDLNGNATSANKVNNQLSFIGYQTKSYDGSQAVEIEIPDKTSQLTNDSNFATTDYVDNKEFVGLNKDSIIRYPKDLPIPEGYELLEEQFSALTDANNELILQAPLTAPQNLLINGNFKINQRGQTTYYANGTNWLYTVDMWRINNHSKLYVNDGYIRFHKVDSDQQALLNQVVKTEGKSITVIKVKEINGTATVRFGDSTVTKTITKSGIFTIKNNTPISSVAIDLVTNGHYIDIEYIDLFEGSIAYSHVEEDDATAMMRCLRYLYKGQLTGVMYGNASTSDYWYSGVSVYPLEMVSIPTVTYDLISIPNIGTLQPSSIVSTAITTRYLGGTIRVNTGRTSVIQPTTYPLYPLTLRFTLSCEPL